MNSKFGSRRLPLRLPTPSASFRCHMGRMVDAQVSDNTHSLSSITPFQSTTPKPGHPLHPILFLLGIYCVVFSFCSSRMRGRRIDAWNILQRDDIFLSISFSRRAFFIERHHDDSFGLRLIVAEIHGKPSGNKIHLIY